MSPFNAWVMLKSLETLPLRVEPSGRRAAKRRRLAARATGRARQGQFPRPSRITRRPRSSRRQMSGPSTLIAFEVAGGKDGAFRVAQCAQLIRISNNLGDAKSLIVHPATTTHQRFTPEVRASMGVGDGLIRLSIGLEHPDDLIADLKQALDG
jgi:O-succinylhomoserine sulfhydrylase